MHSALSARQEPFQVARRHTARGGNGGDILQRGRPHRHRHLVVRQGYRRIPCGPAHILAKLFAARQARVAGSGRHRRKTVGCGKGHKRILPPLPPFLAERRRRRAQKHEPPLYHGAVLRESRAHPFAFPGCGDHHRRDSGLSHRVGRGVRGECGVLQKGEVFGYARLPLFVQKGDGRRQTAHSAFRRGRGKTARDDGDKTQPFRRVPSGAAGQAHRSVVRNKGGRALVRSRAQLCQSVRRGRRA